MTETSSSAAVSRNMTIMFTDMTGFTAKTSAISRQETVELLEIHRRLILPILERFQGRVVKEIGDAFMVLFESPTNAVLAGVALQKAVFEHQHSSEDPGKTFKIKVAINVGEVSLVNNDVFGEPVNIASRLEGIAEPGEVFFTEAVYLAMNKSEIPSCEVGYRILKGIPDRIKVFKVLQEKPLGEAPEVISPMDSPGVAVSRADAAPVAATDRPQGGPAGVPEPKAMPWRLLVFGLDVVFLGIWMNVFKGLLKDEIFLRIGLFLAIGYFWALWWRFGKTLGMKLVGCRLVTRNQTSPRFLRCLFRSILLACYLLLLKVATGKPGVTLILLLALLWQRFDKERLPLIDRLSGLIVTGKAALPEEVQS